MVSLDAATVLLQWAAGGMLFLWVTTRHRIVSLGYGDCQERLNCTLITDAVEETEHLVARQPVVRHLTSNDIGNGPLTQMLKHL